MTGRAYPARTLLSFLSFFVAAHGLTGESSNVNTCKPYLNPTAKGGKWFITGPAPSPPSGEISDLTTQPFNIIISAGSNWPYQTKLRGNQEDFLVQYMSALGLTKECYSDDRRNQIKADFADVGDGQGRINPFLVFREKQPGEPRDGLCDQAVSRGLRVKAWRQNQSAAQGCLEPAYFINAGLYAAGQGQQFQGFDKGRDEFVRRVKQGGTDWIDMRWNPAKVDEIRVASVVGEVAVITVPRPGAARQ